MEPGKNQFIKFSGLAFEMLAFVLLGLYGGMKLDEYLEIDSSIFTVAGSLVGCVLAMIMVIRKLPKD